MGKPTWTLKEDLPDTMVTSRNLEAEQEQNLIAQIGLTLWGALQEMEHERTKP